ncbi:MAG: PAS domain S-box protein [Chloroflexi bacterium]|nr:PAS domain S-box protein [Chloroflexota bacterium]
MKKEARLRNLLPRFNALPIQDPVEYRMGLLLQVILLGFMVVILIAVVLNLLIAPEIPWQVVLGRNFVFIVVLGIPALLLRKGYFRASALIVIGIFFLLEAIAVLALNIREASDTFSFFTLATILAGLLLGRRTLAALFLLSAGVVMYGAVVLPQGDDAGLNGLAIAFNFILLNGLIVLFIDRFGITLRAALTDALSREGELKQETLERRKAEQELRESEERFRVLAENSVAGILISDVKGEIIYVNETLANIFEFETSEEFIAANTTNLYKDAATRFDLLQRLRYEGKVVNYEAEMLTKTGRSITVLHSTRLEGDHLFGTLVDITERKRSEEERERLIEELTSKNAELERFTYTVSHDLKSPLVTIKGFLGYLEQDVMSGNVERLKKDSKRIANAVDKMAQLLDDLLDLSRVGRFVNPPELIPFDELARQAIELTQVRIQEYGITIHQQKDMPAVYGDRPRMIEVLHNLIDNAVKYMDHRRKPVIELGTQGFDKGKPIFFVKDNGIGIALEYQESIFKLFNKLDAASEGTGVGLALVKRIIEVHGGRIWVESAPGKGSTFYFTLPGTKTAEL